MKNLISLPGPELFSNKEINSRTIKIFKPQYLKIVMERAKELHSVELLNRILNLQCQEFRLDQEH